MKVNSLETFILLFVWTTWQIINAEQDFCRRYYSRIQEEEEDVRESCSGKDKGKSHVCNEAKLAMKERWLQYSTLCPQKDIKICGTIKDDCHKFATCTDTGPGQHKCTCNEGYIGDGKTCKVGTSCSNLYKNGARVDGVYIIDPDGKGKFKVRCDMKTSGGGWTVFQRRMDGSVDFYRGWDDYKKGFGDLNGEFWLGLDKIHRLANSGKDVIRVDLKDYEGEESYAEYKKFSVSEEDQLYSLRFSSRSKSGDAGYGLTPGRLTTKDRDNDDWENGNCAVKHHSAWWYWGWDIDLNPSNFCAPGNLNGKYQRNNSDEKGIYWYAWKPPYRPLKQTEMKFRPLNF